MNKTLSVIVIVVVVVLGGYFLFKGTSQTTPSVYQTSKEQPNTQPSTSKPLQKTSASQVQAIKENLVTYTNSGYLPATLKVKKGETVIFKNQSSQSMWTASAMHPTHREYPTTGGCFGSTFDACAGIQPGANWKFKFDIVGAWKYHNHLNPTDFGMIVAE